MNRENRRKQRKALRGNSTGRHFGHGDYVYSYEEFSRLSDANKQLVIDKLAKNMNLIKQSKQSKQQSQEKP